MKISRILSSKNWVAINLPLSKQLGLNAAFLFSHLCGLFEYYETRGELIEKDGQMYFYATIETIAENTPLSRPEQDTAIKILEQAGLLIKKTLGMPAKRYFSIPTSAETILYNILQFAGNRQTSLQETDKQGCANPTNKVVEKEQTSLQETDNNIDKELDLSNNTTFSKEKDSSEKTEVFSADTKNKKIAANSNLDVGLFSKKENQTEKEKNCDKKEKAETPETEVKPTRTKFIPPTVEAVELYCQASGHFVDARRFIDYYTTIGWKVGKNPMKDWQAAVRTWAGKDYNNNNNQNKNNNQNATTQPTIDPTNYKRREEWLADIKI
jgi:hypothetical protein